MQLGVEEIKTFKYIFYARGGSKANVSKDVDYLKGKAGWKFAIGKVVVLHRFEVRQGLGTAGAHIQGEEEQGALAKGHKSKVT